MKNVAGVILAGGLSRRMKGPEKSQMTLNGKSLLQHVVDRISPQVTELVLNANGEHERFSDLNLPIVSDDVPDNPGPLAGLIAGMSWIKGNAPDTEWMLSVPCDTPILPKNMSQLFTEVAQQKNADILMAQSGGRVHPVIGLWRVELLEDLKNAVIHENIRKVLAFSDRYTTVNVEWSIEPQDPFGNINTPEELETAKSWLS